MNGKKHGIFFLMDDENLYATDATLEEFVNGMPIKDPKSLPWSMKMLKNNKLNAYSL